MNSRLCLAPSAVAVALFAANVFAQTPAAAPAPMPAVPQSTCVQPEFPGAFADSRRFERFNKEYKTYADCIKKYIDETKVISDAAIEAGNKAIKEFNTFSAELEARQAAVKK